MKRSPLHRDTLALCGVLVEELDEEGAAVFRHRLLATALNLLDDVTLALASSEPGPRLEDADAGLQILRTHLQLASSLNLLDEPAYLELAEQADRVGRQIGGWLKKLRQTSV